MNKTTFEKNGSTLIVKRNFDASIEKLWKTWTQADLLDKWWAPAPWKSVTKRMEFKQGGERLYAMVGPNGEEHWGLTSYKNIVDNESFNGEDAFCDNEGIINEAFPISIFKNEFIDNQDHTQVIITTKYASEEALQQVIEMGMEEGLTMTLDALDSMLMENE